MRRVRFAAAATILAAAGLALAATSPLLISVSITDAVLYVVTGQMPKGWFSSQNTFDRAKTTLVTTYDFGATACSAAASGGSISSATQGNFTAVTNSQGQAVAWVYDTSQDLASAQNHWHDHTLCDGTVEVDGCAQAKTATVTTTAYAASGACRTFVDDAGNTVCASDTQTASLPAVHDQDVTDTDCAPAGCDLGPCVSACNAQCDATYPDPKQGKARADCHDACHCTCKQQNPACTIGVGECD